MSTIKSDEFIRGFLTKCNQELGSSFKSDVIAIRAPIRFGLDDAIRHEIEELHVGKSKRPDRLTVVIETTGGYIEVVERIYNVFRHHYPGHVEFIVPNFAYSAGTVLVLSGDEIYMDDYSILGPIDPQYETVDNKFVPGLGYLQKFAELTKKINAEKDPQQVRAELAYLLRKFDPATLFLLEQARDHSVSLLEEWLPKHKFKNWTVRQTSGKPVTAAYKRRRANIIATTLANPERWHSHGRGIGIRELTSDELRLKIKNFGADKASNEKIRQYYDLLVDYCSKLGARTAEHMVIHSQRGLRRLS